MTIRSLIISVFALVLILSFQNCSGQANMLFSSSNKSSATETDENGRPYDGKIYVLIGNLCPDGTSIQGRIVLKSSVSADLVRYQCQEIAPLALTASEFTLNPNNAYELEYKNQTFVNMLVGTKINLSSAYQDVGFSYMLVNDFGTAADDGTNVFISPLQIYEDGKPLGPAHSPHIDISNIGMGRFSYWTPSAGVKVLRFSSSDNSNPLTNGRTYTYEILNQPPASPSVSLQSIFPLSSDSNNFYFKYSYSGSVQFHRVFIDTDSNASTGMTQRSGVGAEYMVENGSLYHYTGSNGLWGWTLVKSVAQTNANSTMTIPVPRTDLGSPSSFKYMLEVEGSGSFISRSAVLQ